MKREFRQVCHGLKPWNVDSAISQPLAQRPPSLYTKFRVNFIHLTIKLFVIFRSTLKIFEKIGMQNERTIKIGGTKHQQFPTTTATFSGKNENWIAVSIFTKENILIEQLTVKVLPSWEKLSRLCVILWWFI